MELIPVIVLAAWLLVALALMALAVVGYRARRQRALRRREGIWLREAEPRVAARLAALQHGAEDVPTEPAAQVPETPVLEPGPLVLDSGPLIPEPEPLVPEPVDEGPGSLDDTRAIPAAVSWPFAERVPRAPMAHRIPVRSRGDRRRQIWRDSSTALIGFAFIGAAILMVGQSLPRGDVQGVTAPPDADPPGDPLFPSGPAVVGTTIQPGLSFGALTPSPAPAEPTSPPPPLAGPTSTPIQPATPGPTVRPPVTARPTTRPTARPTEAPTPAPTTVATASPEPPTPSPAPTDTPTPEPTDTPTPEPTSPPTPEPTPPAPTVTP